MLVAQGAGCQRGVIFFREKRRNQLKHSFHRSELPADGEGESGEFCEAGGVAAAGGRGEDSSELST
ncbi:hypothetical protein SAMN05661091_2985 [Paenibacillus uliginis N3/975]|uniref:Uncharacterized protein n=1 Tax=Paenibacillus uliginis N3/975 TaxID=1313296 RepID=A0A1X7HF85_9BACL|nr:hypothetical protein SAMN05661091_2985 [Paenibacillus uliginis N3/975]